MNLKKKTAIFTVVTGSILESMHLANKFIYHTSTIYNFLNNKEGQYYNWKFGRIFYTKQGSGKPILLIHDLNTCSSSYEWNKITKELSKTNTVYTIDLLGCGRSDKPNLIYTNYLYVQLITDFIKTIITEKTDVITTGFSSSIILMTCVNNDSIIDKAILVNPEKLLTLSKVPNSFHRFYQFFISCPIIGTFIYNVKVNKKSIKTDFEKNYYYDLNKINEKDILTYYEASQKSKTHTKYLYASIQSKFVNMNIMNCFRKLKNNIFIITGNSNPENNLIAEQYQNQLSSIKIAAINNARHLPQMELPDEFLKNVKKLFDIQTDTNK